MRNAPLPRLLVLAVGPLLTFGCHHDHAVGPSPAQRAAHAATDAANVPAPPTGAKVPKPLEDRAARVPEVPPVARDLPQIAADGKLRVLFTFNSTGYFMYRGDTMGFEYDLLELFARASHLALEPVVVRDGKALFDQLNRGEGDVVAAQLAASPSEQSVLMTAPLYQTAPVVVQRKEPITIRARRVTVPGDLAGQQVHVSKVSPFRWRLLELRHQLDDDVDVVEVDESTEKLIQRLAEGQISFTVAPENVAALRAEDYTNLVIQPAIGPPQPIVWAVRKTSPELQGALDDWLEKERRAGLLAALYKKYFLDRRGFRQRAQSPYLTAETGQLSPYDGAFRSGAQIPGWDWRLVAAEAYQESRFDPHAHSWAGAVGLMQIMPRTARELHVDARDPAQNVAGACRYLERLDKAWESLVPDASERIRYTLAAYNVGLGHVEDAVRLAQKHGQDAGVWLHVAYWLLLESKREVYDDPVVKYGYARGAEPVNYVDDIVARWRNYREFVPDSPAPAAPMGSVAPASPPGPQAGSR